MTKRNGLIVEISSWEVDRFGNPPREKVWRRSNTLLRAFAQYLTVHMGQASQNIIDKTNTSRSQGINNQAFDVTASAGITTKGILIGTGTSAVTRADYNLQTQVTASITHGAMSISVENPDVDTWRVLLERAFTNNTGAALNITEVGLMTQSSIAYFYLLDRTLYNLTINNGAARTISYRITI
jgi:hypothetical protein